MAVASKTDIADLVERVSTLPDEDRNVLKRLSRQRPVLLVQLASDLYILPRQVNDSVQRLRDGGFVEEVEPDPSDKKWTVAGDHAIQLSPEGEEAQTVLPLVEKTRGF